MSSDTRTRPRRAGRRTKTRADARARVAGQFTRLGATERQRRELLSLVSALFCRGATGAEITQRVLQDFPKDYGVLLRGENLWDLLREAAAQHLFVHTPRDDDELTHRLLDDYPWLEDHVLVAQTVSTDALAQRAARKLLDMIRTVRQQRQCETVHVGFAGGMSLRRVAERLAQLLGRPHPNNPDTIVFHAMVANFDDDDFYADPNSFISYFTAPECGVKVRLVRLPLPGIIESAKYEQIRGLAGIEQVFERRREIQIVVTSGSLWSDRHSTLRTYLNAAIYRSPGSADAGQEPGSPAAEVTDEFQRLGVVGDLLWQPINSQGPVEIHSEFQVTTLMPLNELPAFIDGGGSVLLVMGCSGISRLPKSEVLKTILDLYPQHRWVTDLVTDSPTVQGIYSPQPQ